MPKRAVLFAGQGAQYVGMARSLAEKFPPARDFFDRASELLGFDLLDTCLNGPEERLNATDVSQPAIFVASWAAVEWARAEQPELLDGIEAAAGLSLGEYTACVWAGVFEFESGIRLVVQRGRAMQTASERVPSGMASVLGASREQVEQLIADVSQAGRLWIANLLCPGNIVVSGETAALEALERHVGERDDGVRVVRLAVAGAFHTPIMQPAQEALSAAIDATELRDARCPVYSNVDAAPHTAAVEIRELLKRQLMSPVLWEQSIRRMVEDGVEEFLEVGPKRVLRGLLRRIDRTLKCVNLEV